jgi:hypothetical protein
VVLHVTYVKLEENITSVAQTVHMTDLFPCTQLNQSERAKSLQEFSKKIILATAISFKPLIT